MKKLTLEEVVAAMHGRCMGGPSIASVSRVCTDSRSVRPGDLFFALRGEHHDGHEFVDAALEAGAAAAVITNPAIVPTRWHAGGRLIAVPDVAAALGQLAAYHRGQCAATVIAVAGSNGKTTTKELIGAVLTARRRGQVAAKSFNNHIGVPTTLLSVEPADEFVVVEIGTNHPGEVAALAQMARPDLAVITSLGEEHLEFFGDVERVAKEELSLLRSVRPRGFAALHEACFAYPDADARPDLTRVRFGFEAGAELRASDLSCDGRGQRFRVNARFEYELPALGVHNVSNALAAIAVGLRLGLTHEQIGAALRSAVLPPMRLEVRPCGAAWVVNDAYNANPSSMRAALAAFEQVREPGRRVLVLGDMRELGHQAPRCHEELGRAAGRSSAAVVIAVGSFARTVADGATSTAGAAKRIYAFPSVQTLAAQLERQIEPGDVILLKGSRAMQLERLLPQIEALAAEPVRG